MYHNIRYPSPLLSFPWLTPTLPALPTLSYPTLPCLALPYATLPYSTLPYAILVYPILLYPTLPSLPYRTRIGGTGSI